MSKKRIGRCHSCGTVLSKKKSLCWLCAEKKKVSQRNAILKAKSTCLKHYGGVCFCCTESYEPWLVLDHADGGGTQHRKKRKCRSMWEEAVKDGLPPYFQLACWNCNGTRGENKYCPNPACAKKREKLLLKNSSVRKSKSNANGKEIRSEPQRVFSKAGG